jgi:GNAT superfamily N-acetyltransferase
VPFEIEIRAYDDPDVARMVDEVQTEYVARYGGPDQAAVDPAEFAPPDGLFLVGLLDGTPVAMGGWRRRGGSQAELKRMYVSAAARRRGIARLLLAELERTAAAAGITRLLLNTGPAQPEAVALYRQAGYTPVPGFGHYACHPDALFFGKSLTPVGSRPDWVCPYSDARRGRRDSAERHRIADDPRPLRLPRRVGRTDPSGPACRPTRVATGHSRERPGIGPRNGTAAVPPRSCRRACRTVRR